MEAVTEKIKRAVFLILQEQENAKPEEEKPEEKPAPKAKEVSINIARGATGRGNFSKFVGEARARADDDPAGLMKDLGVTTAPGATDVDKVKNILQTAINSNGTMREAYSGATGATVSVKGQLVKGVKVFVAGIKQRDGIKFISYTLLGAKNADILNLQGSVEIGVADDAIFIQSI